MMMHLAGRLLNPWCHLETTKRRAVQRNTVRARLVPSFAKEGWLRHKEAAPFLRRRRRGSCFKTPIIKTVRHDKR